MGVEVKQSAIMQVTVILASKAPHCGSNCLPLPLILPRQRQRQGRRQNAFYITWYFSTSCISSRCILLCTCAISFELLRACHTSELCLPMPPPGNPLMAEPAVPCAQPPDERVLASGAGALVAGLLTAVLSRCWSQAWAASRRAWASFKDRNGTKC